MTVPATTTTTDLDAARRFLARLHEHQAGWLSLFAQSTQWSRNKTLWAELPDVDSLIDRIVPFVDHANVWVGVAPRRTRLTGSKRGSRDDCTTIPGLWVDIDVYGEGHVAEDLPRTFGDARGLLDEFPLPPTVVIDSGHGFQAYWLFQEPLEIGEQSDELIKRWGATWKAKSEAHGWGIDNVWDYARIMRLPGTVNNKTDDARPVIIVDEHWDRRFGCDDIDQWLHNPRPPASNTVTTVDRSVPYIGPERPGDAFNASADPAKLLERHGFVFAYEDHGDRHYYAPHRAGSKERTGATVYADGHTTIYSGTFARAAGMDEKRPYDPFGLYTHLEHRGDWRRATQSLADAGYGQQAVDLGDLIADMPKATPLVINDEQDAEDDWARRDVATVAREIIAGERQRAEPEILMVDGGLPLIYRGRTHSLFGPPGGGKTWVALSAAAEHLKSGENVLMIDWEDHIDGAIGRMIQLGCTLDDLERFDYRSPSTSLLYGWPTLEADTTPWTLVIMDSAGEAMSAGGINPNDDGEVAAWMMLAKRLTRRPDQPAVLMLDHVPKATDAPHVFAIGSQRKLAAITGASYRCDTLVEPAIGKPGKLKLVVAKDRLGHRAKGSTAAEVHMADVEHLIDISLKVSEAQAAAERGEKFRPTVLMERISMWLEFRPGATKRKIRDEITGKRAAIDTALEVLIEEGHVRVDKDGQSHVHTVVNPYRESADELAKLVDNSHRGPVAHRGPTVAPVARATAETDRGPRGPGGQYTGPRATVQGVETSQGVAPVDISAPDYDPLSILDGF